MPMKGPAIALQSLKQISKHHGAKFPRQEIYDVIDGGKLKRQLGLANYVRQLIR